jgi:hypothetical protein
VPNDRTIEVVQRPPPPGFTTLESVNFFVKLGKLTQHIRMRWEALHPFEFIAGSAKTYLLKQRELDAAPEHVNIFRKISSLMSWNV